MPVGFPLGVPAQPCRNARSRKAGKRKDSSQRRFRAKKMANSMPNGDPHADTASSGCQALAGASASARLAARARKQKLRK
jgi:hypothetical protein